MPEETILSSSLNKNQNIYFIENGVVELYRESQHGVLSEDVYIGNLKKGEYFGEVGFFTGHSGNIKFKTSEFTTLLKVKREDFL